MFSILAFSATCFTLVFTFVLIARSIVRSRHQSRAGLFRFHNGKRVQSVDPIAALMALENHPQFRFDIHPRRVIEDQDTEAMGIVSEAVRVAFRVPPFVQPGQPGLTVYECCELLTAFVGYVDLQKKSTSSTPTSQPSSPLTSTGSEETTTLDTSATF